jgi:transmembrane sensor
MKKNRHEKPDIDVDRVAYLISGYIRQTLTVKEHDELDEWVLADDKNMLRFEELTDEKHLEANLAWMDQVKSKEQFDKLNREGKFEKPVRRIYKVWLAAASILLIIGIILFYQFRHHRTGVKNELAMNDSTKLQPGGNRAILLLTDGKVIDLTTAKNGLLPNSEGSHVSKLADGEIVYDEADPVKGLFSIHTLSTPVGGQYQVKLPDGTKVWLNAATKITYPTHFASSSRSIDLSGEAYFEVAKDKERPFKVSIGGAEVEVLGTHFNINAYIDEPFMNVTLIEGSVKVSNIKGSKVLSPGKQAQFKGDEIQVIPADTSEAIAWKSNEFKFVNAPIDVIMRQVKRWYDAEVVSDGKVDYHFNATIDRNEPVTKLLHYLEETGHVHFKIEGRKIIVMK